MERQSRQHSRERQPAHDEEERMAQERLEDQQPPRQISTRSQNVSSFLDLNNAYKTVFKQSDLPAFKDLDNNNDI